jgi:hypothetical protein
MEAVVLISGAFVSFTYGLVSEALFRIFVKFIFMVVPWINDVKFFISPTNAHKLY